jgi:tetratricopeptide (TPR) repeat protein
VTARERHKKQEVDSAETPEALAEHPSADRFAAVKPDDDTELMALARTIRRGKGFSLILARSNTPVRRTELTSRLREMLPSSDLMEIHLDHPVRHLLDYLRTVIPDKAPDAIFVSGLEESMRSLNRPEQSPLVLNLNASRNSFAEVVPCPLILWASDYVLTAISHGAPDFFAVRSGVYYFSEPVQSRGATRDRLSEDDSAELIAPVEERRQRIRELEEMLAELEVDSSEKRDRDAESRLHYRLGDLLRVGGRLKEARGHFERALHIDEGARGLDHPTVATDVSGLGLVLKDQGDLAGAAVCFKRALKIIEAIYGPEHPKVAIIMNNVGAVLQDQGDFAGANACCERALKIDEAVYGADHPEVAIDRNNLGTLLVEQGDLGGAKDCYERALKIDETVYGPDHPNVARDVNNLGSVLQDQGDLAGAMTCYKRAVEIDEVVYGPDHPNVAMRANNLGSVLHDQGDLAGAKALHERALKIDEAVYGPDHPNVARDMNNLGFVLKEQGDFAGAKASFERALAIEQVVHGPNHPAVAGDLNNLGRVLQDQGDLAGAKACYERSLAIVQRFRGASHPNTVTVRQNLESLNKALQLQERV